MLYNPKWESKRDIFSWDSLVAWLETKSPKQEYSYYRLDCYMLAKYFGEMTGDKYVSVGQVNACMVVVGGFLWAGIVSPRPKGIRSAKLLSGRARPIRRGARLFAC